jgi:prepilin-type N-terminal cleavage/methylation domain-containing protein/prepilin-type processing-associated H-X9-DG protein
MARVSCPSPSWRRGFTLLELLVVIAILAVLAAILFPVFATTHHRRGPGSLCTSHVKQLTMALQMYAVDHEDRLPPAYAWHDAISPYVKSSVIWACPSRKNQKPGYSFNALLHFGKLSPIVSPEVPMVFESMIGRWNASDLGASFVTPHGGRGVVGYTDGHVKVERTLPPPDAALIKRPVAPKDAGRRSHGT